MNFYESSYSLGIG